MQELKGIEKEMFSNINARNQTIDYLIKNSKEILYLDLISYRKYGTSSKMSEIDFCLDLYNKFIKKSSSKFSSKKVALLESVKYIESRDQPFFLETY
ncbi:MAG TPA: hypothetical protein VJ895_02645 [Candidatus Nanoarchaeia archaeon]|nr:hypothetical protein [Candidatus Nanoarchaeia archaeon]